MALFTKTILLLQSYMFWKITVNIVAILRYSIIVWQSFVIVDVSVFIKMKKKSNIVTVTKIYELRFELVDHSSYSANLVSNDFFLFSRLKVWLDNRDFHQTKTLTSTNTNECQTTTDPKQLQFSQAFFNTYTIVVIEWVLTKMWSCSCWDSKSGNEKILLKSNKL